MSKSSKTKTKPNARVIRRILAIGGVVLMLFGGALTAFTYDFVNNSLVASGTVVSVARDTSGDSVTYRPTIRFVDVTGRKHVAETFLSSSSYNFARGSKVEVLYDLRDPSAIRLNTFFAVWGFGAVFLAAGIGAFIVSRFISSKGKDKTYPKRTWKKRKDDIIEIPARAAGLVSRETREDHERETNYVPTVRRRR